MNWYKESQEISPIRINSYNRTYNELGVLFAGNNQVYTYYHVSPYLYEKIKNLLRFKNYSEVKKILDRLSALENHVDV